MLPESGIYKTQAICPNSFQYIHETILTTLKFYEYFSIESDLA